MNAKDKMNLSLKLAEEMHENCLGTANFRLKKAMLGTMGGGK